VTGDWLDALVALLDGSWFVFVGASDTPLSAGPRVVLNWFDQPWKP